MNYCAGDVAATFEVTKKLFPIFLERVPHPVSFAALRHLGNLILPTTTKWDKYIESAESCYEKNRVEVTSTIEERANDLIQFVVQENPDLLPDYESDPWLSQLNWTLKEAKLKKDGSLPKKRAYLTGYPEWYRDLFRGTSGRIMNLTLRTRITPLLLRLKWEGYPLFWVDSQGWCFKVPYGDQEAIEKLTAKNYTQPKLPEEEFDVLESLQSGGTSYVLFKVPHPDGPKARCTHVLSKQYVRYFEDGTLTSEYEHAHKILKLNNEASYWLSNRNRINDQFVVYNQEDKNKFFDTKKESKEHKDMAIILPNLATMGTITRRATENTWLTASNAKKDRIGSELKSLIEAPKGYCFIGADVDSEELWIASLVGDSMFEIHGGTALGWMTLEGEKSQKTDLHSKTSSILGISRNNAKVFNYGRIYGAGIKFASRLLKQFNASLSDLEADEIAKKLYDNTKGMTGRSKHFGANQPKLYYGGSESVMFNALEAIAQQDEPRTPVLGARITDALNVKNLRNNNYMTSRVNWTIQSSGVDYLHLLIVSMEYLSEKYGVDARLAITVHDELRYLVKEEDKYKAALLLQISNVWTRAMFCEQLGIKEVPQSCAFFSEVDIDFVLRKEVSMDCVTPSNPTPIPHGESLNIAGLLEKCRQGDILDDDKKKTKPLTLNRVKYTARKPVIYDLDKNLSRACKVLKIKLQSSNDAAEWKKNLYAFAKIKGQQLFQTDNVPSSKGKTSEEPKKPRKSYKKKNREILDIDLETKTEKKGKKGKYVASAKKTNYDDEGKYLKPPYLREDMWKDEPIVTWHRTPPPPPSQPISFAASSRPIYKKDGFSQYSTGSRSASSSSESQFKYHRRHASSLTPDRLRRGVRLRNEKRSEDYEVTK
jgi:DNA polymerase gamma 1